MSKPELKEADKQAFIDALNDFGVIFGRDITPELLNVYWRHLSKKMDLDTRPREVFSCSERLYSW
jgi:hypothetical protein